MQENEYAVSNAGSEKGSGRGGGRREEEEGDNEDVGGREKEARVGEITSILLSFPIRKVVFPLSQSDSVHRSRGRNPLNKLIKIIFFGVGTCHHHDNKRSHASPHSTPHMFPFCREKPIRLQSLLANLLLSPNKADKGILTVAGPSGSGSSLLSPSSQQPPAALLCQFAI